MPPLRLTVQVMFSFTAADDGQLMLLLITGAAMTITLVEPLSLSAELRTVSETVLLPDELKLVEYLRLLPLDEPPLHE